MRCSDTHYRPARTARQGDPRKQHAPSRAARRLRRAYRFEVTKNDVRHAGSRCVDISRGRDPSTKTATSSPSPNPETTGLLLTCRDIDATDARTLWRRTRSYRVTLFDRVRPLG